MSLTKSQKQRVGRHVGEMAFIAGLIIILWAVVAILKSQGF